MAQRREPRWEQRGQRSQRANCVRVLRPAAKAQTGLSLATKMMSMVPARKKMPPLRVSTSTILEWTHGPLDLAVRSMDHTKGPSSYLAGVTFQVSFQMSIDVWGAATPQRLSSPQPSEKINEVARELGWQPRQEDHWSHCHLDREDALAISTRLVDLAQHLRVSCRAFNSHEALGSATSWHCGQGPECTQRSRRPSSARAFGAECARLLSSPGRFVVAGSSEFHFVCWGVWLSLL